MIISEIVLVSRGLSPGLLGMENDDLFALSRLPFPLLKKLWGVDVLGKDDAVFEDGV